MGVEKEFNRASAAQSLSKGRGQVAASSKKGFLSHGLGIETSRVGFSGLETQLSTKMLVTEAHDLGFSTQ